MIIGVSADQPGWGLVQEGYHRSGFDYDLANWLGNELNFRVTFTSVATNQREQMLQQGQVTLIIDAFSKTDLRARSITFAAPYMVNQQGVLVRTGDTRMRTRGDLNDKTVCSAAGSTSIEQLDDVRVKIREEIAFQSCVDALLDGSVDAMSTDQLLLYGYAAADKAGRLSVVPGLVFGHQERYGIGLKHGEIAKCEKVLEALRRFIASGKWDDFFRNNLPGVAPAAHKPDPNLLDPCKDV